MIAAVVAYATVFRPWSRRWGATPEEATMDLPGDELVEVPGIVMTRAVTIDASVDEVWAWLAQMGQERGGFYSYEWLENPAGHGSPLARSRTLPHRSTTFLAVLVDAARGPRLARRMKFSTNASRAGSNPLFTEPSISSRFAGTTCRWPTPRQAESGGPGLRLLA